VDNEFSDESSIMIPTWTAFFLRELSFFIREGNNSYVTCVFHNVASAASEVLSSFSDVEAIFSDVNAKKSDVDLDFSDVNAKSQT